MRRYYANITWFHTVRSHGEWFCEHDHRSYDSAWACAVKQARRDLQVDRSGTPKTGAYINYGIRIRQQD